MLQLPDTNTGATGADNTSARSSPRDSPRFLGNKQASFTSSRGGDADRRRPLWLDEVR